MDENYGIPVSKAELRKVNKPLMEKRRRARINSCLSQLKMLVLQAVKKEGCSYSKLEKADILEMTVQYLKTVQKNQMISAATADPSVINRYTAGYAECTNEAVRYLSTMDGVDKQLKSRLVNHLTVGVTDNVDNIHQESPPYAQGPLVPKSPFCNAGMFSFEESRLAEVQTALRMSPPQKMVTSSHYVEDVCRKELSQSFSEIDQNLMKTDCYSVNLLQSPTTTTSEVSNYSTSSSPVSFASSATSQLDSETPASHSQSASVASMPETVWRPW